MDRKFLLIVIACAIMAVTGIAVASHRMAPKISEVMKINHETVKNNECSRALISSEP